MEIRELFKDIIENKKLIEGVISKKRSKDNKDFNRIDFRLVEIRNEIMVQLSYIYSDRVEHENLSLKKAVDYLSNIFEEDFRQANIFSLDKDIQMMLSKKKKLKIIERPASKKSQDLSHNRDKEYILNEGDNIDFLVSLGIMDKNYKVKARSYSKFRQINRYLEFIDDIYPRLKKEGTIRLVDFGSGKSYLTFAVYYYLRKIKGRDVDIVGLDLKEDVIRLCNKLRDQLNYKGLNFYCMDIKDYRPEDDMDMVITLHACNNATDMAIANGIKWNSQVIMTVPCCQKELFNKINNDSLDPILKHGFLKDKLASILTDSLRGLVLEIYGYKTQIIEFIETEHTPKNNLIRSYKESDKINEEALEAYYRLKEEFNLGEIFIESYIDKDRKIFNR